MRYDYITLVFFLILVFLLLTQASNAAAIINAAGMQATNQIGALQGQSGAGLRIA